MVALGYNIHGHKGTFPNRKGVTMNDRLKLLFGGLVVAVALVIGIKHYSSPGNDEVLVINTEDKEGISESEDNIKDITPSPEIYVNTEVVVHVCGEVTSPGVYTLSYGSRVYEAIRAAGGVTDNADADAVNQADMLSDGMRLYIPAEGELPDSNAVYDVGASGQSDGLVNINTATKEELMTLRGVGESKAESIIAYRENNGPFNSIEDIMNITGIKEGLFNKVKDYIKVR